MTTTNESNTKQAFVERDMIAVRFAGDSGDGMQLTGSQFTNTTAIYHAFPKRNNGGGGCPPMQGTSRNREEFSIDLSSS